MNTDMPVFVDNFLHIKFLSVLTDNFTCQEFAFSHDSFWLLLFLIDDDSDNYENSRKYQNKQKTSHNK